MLRPKRKIYKNRISELTNDNVEIEKKWLIDKENIKYDLSEAKIYEIEQTYINFSPEIRVRRVNNSQFSFTLKKNTSADGMIRDEIDFLINEDEYNELITKKVGETIFKTRYKIFKDKQNRGLFANTLFNMDYFCRRFEFCNLFA